MTNGGSQPRESGRPHVGWHAFQRGIFWIGTERSLTRQRHYNLVFLHARRQRFPAFAEIALAVHESWPWGEVASVAEIASRLAPRWPAMLVEAALWKVVADAAAAGIC